MGRAAIRNGAARLCVYDVETSFNIGGYFGPVYDRHIAKVIQAHYVFGFAYKFVGERKTHSVYIWDFPRYRKEPRNDIEVIKAWAELMLNSDLVIGHNSDQFDNKVMMGRMLVHRLQPVPLPQSVDTKKVAKRVARFDSNKLDDLGELLGLGRKIHTNVDLWWDCMQGDAKAQRKMVRYNKQDVVLTEELYLAMMPYDTRHPNLANIIGRPDVCPKCESDAGMLAQGWRYTKTGKNRVFQCKSCWSKVTLRMGEKGTRPTYV